MFMWGVVSGMLNVHFICTTPHGDKQCMYLFVILHTSTPVSKGSGDGGSPNVPKVMTCIEKDVHFDLRRTTET